MTSSKQRIFIRRHSAQTLGTRWSLASYNQIRQCAHEIYAAYGGTEAMMLKDWLKAEQDLRRMLEKEKPTAATSTLAKGGIKRSGTGVKSSYHHSTPSV